MSWPDSTDIESLCLRVGGGSGRMWNRQCWIPPHSYLSRRRLLGVVTPLHKICSYTLSSFPSPLPTWYSGNDGRHSLSCTLLLSGKSNRSDGHHLCWGCLSPLTPQRQSRGGCGNPGPPEGGRLAKGFVRRSDFCGLPPSVGLGVGFGPLTSLTPLVGPVIPAIGV